MYIAVDPGETTGYALFNSDGAVTEKGKIRGEDPFLDKFEEIAATGTYKVLIIEAYRSRPGAINAWSKNKTSQTIGAVKRIARKAGMKIVEQEPNPGLVIGLKFLGVSHLYPKGKHVPDDISALAHGTYYLRQQKVL